MMVASRFEFLLGKPAGFFPEKLSSTNPTLRQLLQRITLGGRAPGGGGQEGEKRCCKARGAGGSGAAARAGSRAAAGRLPLPLPRAPCGLRLPLL